MTEKCGYFWGRLLSPLEWAFVVFHLMEDQREGRERARQERREDWAIAWLTQHNIERARSYILDEPQDEDATEQDIDPQQFLVTDRYFSDRRSLDAVLGSLHQEEERS